MKGQAALPKCLLHIGTTHATRTGPASLPGTRVRRARRLKMQAVDNDEEARNGHAPAKAVGLHRIRFRKEHSAREHIAETRR